jgi:hypothetical protein
VGLVVEMVLFERFFLQQQLVFQGRDAADATDYHHIFQMPQALNLTVTRPVQNAKPKLLCSSRSQCISMLYLLKNITLSHSFFLLYPSFIFNFVYKFRIGSGKMGRTKCLGV